MAEVPFTNGSYSTPSGVDTGYISNPRVTNAGAALGEGLSRAGEVAGQISERIEQQNNLTSVQDAMNQFQDHVRNVQYGDDQTPGFFNSQGKSAMSALQPATQGIDQYRRSLMQGMTPTQQRLFNDQSSSFQESAFGTMAAHASRERQQWVDDTQTARINTLGNTAAASRNNPQALQSSFTEIFRAINQRGATEGLAPDNPILVQRRADAMDTASKKIVTAYLADNDPIGGRNYLDANGSKLSEETKNQMEISLHHPVLEKQAQIWAQQKFGPSIRQVLPIDGNANVADVLTAQEQAESGGKQLDKDGTVLRSMPGDPDSPRGVMQIRPSTAQDAAKYAGIQFDANRLDNDPAYNRGLGHAKMYQLCQKYGNNFTLACAAYNWGEGNVDKALKEHGDPRTGAVTDADFLSHTPTETQHYVSKISSAVSPQALPPSHTAPDFEGAVREAMSGPDWEENMAKLSQVSQMKTVWEAETQSARSDLTDRLTNLISQRAGGNMSGQYPDADVAQLLPPEKAQEWRSKFDAASDAGSQWKAVQWMPPAQQQQYLAQRAAQIQDTNAPDYTIRREGLNQLTAQVNKANEQLHADPAAYVRAYPAMQQAAENLQSASQGDDPDKLRQAQNEYIRQSDAAQRSLGVTSPDVAPKAVTQRISDMLSNIDPEKTNVGAVLNGIRQQYSDENWSRIVSQLHKYNQVPEDVGVLASMYLPEQVTDQAVFANMLHARQIYMQSSGDKSGDGFLQNINPQEMAKLSDTKVNHPIGDKLSAFRATVINNSAGEAAYQQTYNAVKDLSRWYVAQGETAKDAVSLAYDGIIGKAYDFSGTMRVPKGMLPDVIAATDQTRNGIKPDDLAPIPGGVPGMTDEDRKDKGINAIRNFGVWIPTADDKGLQLVIPSRVYGVQYVPKNRDGQPFSVQFSDVQKGAYSPQGHANAFMTDNPEQNKILSGIK
ncbi:transglycosylase SLT domain-containing protein [Acetobacter musti]|uniref:Transglycosylase SLT domain-containing protein n=1 Tax=Acetobacter musti TaxID=864732 RepID=A0ABX0JV06_9PROT|nr:transglycosylase SLT domain-containing protein [Acetobacter musti]NHN85805.1 transglycosylase SLT domain-containing protein [Acetobacter musti]